MCDKLIFTHKKSISQNISNFFLTTFSRIRFSEIAFIDMYIYSGGTGGLIYQPDISIILRRIISIITLLGLSNKRSGERKKFVYALSPTPF